MAITVEDVTSFDVASGDVSQSVVVPSGTQFMVVVFGTGDPNGTPADPYVEWNGTEMTEVVSAVNATYADVHVYKLANPDTGTHNLTIDVTDTPHTAGAIYSLSGDIDTMDVIDFDTDTGSDNDVITTCTATKANHFSAQVLNTDFSAGQIEETGYTEAVDVNVTGVLHSSYNNISGSAGDVTIDTTLGASRNYAGAGFIVEEVASVVSVSSAMSYTDSITATILNYFTVSSALGLAESVTSFAVRTLSKISTITLSSLLKSIKDTFSNTTNQSKEANASMTNASKESTSTVTNPSKSTATISNEAKDLI